MSTRIPLSVLVFSVLLGAGAPLQPGEREQEAAKFWRDTIGGRERRVLDLSVAWVDRPLMLCPGGSWAPADIASLGMLLMYESTGRPEPEGRRQHWNPGLTQKDFSDMCELLLGTTPDGEQAMAVENAYAEYTKGARFGDGASVVRGSRMAPLTLAVYKDVLGRQREFARALASLHKRMGWVAELEEMAAPEATEAIRVGLLRDIPFLFETGKGEWYLGIAFSESESGQRFALMGAVEQFRPWGLTHWEAKGGDEAHASLPPGSGPWRADRGATRRIIPFDTIVSPRGDLPPWFRLVPLPLPEGKVFWVHDLRPDRGEQLAQVATALEIPVIQAKPLSQAGDSQSQRLWQEYVRGHDVPSVCGNWGIVSGLPLVPAPTAGDSREAALASVVLATLPSGRPPDQFAFTQTEFLTAARDARWQGLTPEQQARVRQYYGDGGGTSSGARERRLRLMEDCFLYGCGLSFWGLSEHEASGLRGLWDRLAAPQGDGTGATHAPLASLGRILPEAADWETGVRTIAQRRGWQPTVERTERASFAAIRDAVEMGIPALLEDGDGRCRIAAGFLLDSGREYLLTVDPQETKPWLAAPGTDSAGHLQHLLLPEAAPGRKAYLALVATVGNPVPALLDPRLPLPAGVRFEEFVPNRYRATFLHSWRRSVRPYAKELAGILAPEPPESQGAVPFRMRLPKPFPPLVQDALQQLDAVVDIREAKYSLWPVDRIRLGPKVGCEQGYFAADKDLFAASGLVEMELLPGSYWVWIRNLPVATLNVSPQDKGKELAAQWSQLPAPQEVTVRLPEGTVLYDNVIAVTPYLDVAERRFLGVVGRAPLPQVERRQPITRDNCDFSIPLFPGVFYVYDSHYFLDYEKPPIGKLIVPEDAGSDALSLVPLTPAEAGAATGDPLEPRPRGMDRTSPGVPGFLQ